MGDFLTSHIKGQVGLTHRWAVDYDYIERLTDKEKKFLKKFTNEFYHGRFNSRPIHPKRVAVKRECYNRNNASKRDIFSRLAWKHQLKSLYNRELPREHKRILFEEESEE
jgi:hypothetical protein